MGSAPLTALVERIDSVQAGRNPVVVGLGGSVASGKSTFAAELAAALLPRAVEVVSTDGFLLPNAVLLERDLVLRKGFPETYDEVAILARSFNTMVTSLTQVLRQAQTTAEDLYVAARSQSATSQEVNSAVAV